MVVTAVGPFYELEGAAVIFARPGINPNLLQGGKLPPEAGLEDILLNRFSSEFNLGTLRRKIDKKYKLNKEEQGEDLRVEEVDTGLLLRRGKNSLVLPCFDAVSSLLLLDSFLQDQGFHRIEGDSIVYRWDAKDTHLRSLRIRSIQGIYDNYSCWTCVSKGRRKHFPDPYPNGLILARESEFKSEDQADKAFYEKFFTTILHCKRNQAKDKDKVVRSFDVVFDEVTLHLEYIAYDGCRILEAEHLLPITHSQDDILSHLGHIQRFYDSLGLTSYLLKSGKVSDLAYRFDTTKT